MSRGDSPGWQDLCEKHPHCDPASSAGKLRTKRSRSPRVFASLTLRFGQTRFSGSPPQILRQAQNDTRSGLGEEMTPGFAKVSGWQEPPPLTHLQDWVKTWNQLGWNWNSLESSGRRLVSGLSGADRHLLHKRLPAKSSQFSLTPPTPSRSGQISF